MARYDGSEESPWTLLGSVVGLAILARVAVGVVTSLAHGGLVGLAVLVLVVMIGLRVMTARGTVTMGGGSGRLWRWLRGRPRPLGGEVRWGRLIDLWRAGWIGGTGWPIGVYTALGGLVRVTVRMTSRMQTLGCLLIGPPGKGKTASVVIPIVLSEARIRAVSERHSLIVLDPKGDIVAACRAELERSHEVLVWNPAQPRESTVAVEPLWWVPASPTDPHFQEAVDTAAKIYLAATYGDETGLATSYSTEPFWGRMVSSVFKGILLHLRALDPRLTLLDVARYLAQTTPEDIVRHLTSHPRTEAAALRGATMREMMYNERVRGAVIAELAERAVLLMDPRLTRVMRPGPLPAFDLERFLATPTVLALQVGALGDIMLPLLSVVVATIQAELVRRTRGGTTLPRGVRTIIDEAGVIGRIYGLDTSVALLRSADYGTVIAVQALDQLRLNYGRERTDVMLHALTHRLILGGVSSHDAATFCAELGKRNAYRDLPGVDARGGESTYYTREEWPLFRPDQLRHLHFQMVLDSTELPPFLLRLRHYVASH